MLTASPYCQCNFSIYAQFDPVDSSYSQSEVDIIESEIRNPTGIPYRSPPHFKASIKIFSQNCGVLLSSFAEDPTPPAPSATPVFDVTGLASPALTIKSQHLAFIAFIFCIGELITTINQISHNSNTQSSLSKLSEWSIGMMIITDAYWCLLGLTLGVADCECNFLLVCGRNKKLTPSFSSKSLLRLCKLRFRQVLQFRLVSNAVFTLYITRSKAFGR